MSTSEHKSLGINPEQNGCDAKMDRPETPGQQQTSQSSQQFRSTPQSTIEQQNYAIAAAAAWSSSMLISDMYQRFILPAATMAAASVAGEIGFARISNKCPTNGRIYTCLPKSEANIQSVNKQVRVASNIDSVGLQSRRRRQRRGKRKRRCRKKKLIADSIDGTNDGFTKNES
jgi:hypothetical protein